MNGQKEGCECSSWRFRVVAALQSRIMNTMLALLALAVLLSAGVAYSYPGDRLSVDDPQGDLLIVNVNPSLASGADIVGLEVYYDDGLVIEAEFAGEPQGDLAYIFDLLIDADPGPAYYRIDATWVSGTYTAAFTLEYHPALQGGSLTMIGNQSVTTMIEGNKLRIVVGLDEAYNPFSLENVRSVDLMFQFSLITQQGAITDEVKYAWDASYSGSTPPDSPQDGMEDTGAPVGGEAGETAAYRDLDGNADDVSVSITGEPVVVVRSVGASGTSPGYTVLEVRVSGTSSNAHHVAVAVETFIRGELDSQILYNSYKGLTDDDGPINGYTSYFSIPIQTGLKFEISEKLVPEAQGWSQWSLNASYTIPLVQAPGYDQLSNLVDIVRVIKGGDVEVYVTAIAYKDSGEALYNTATKKASLEIAGAGGGAPQPEAGGNEGQGSQEAPGDSSTTDNGEASTGIPVSVIAGVVLAVIVIALAKKLIL